VLKGVDIVADKVSMFAPFSKVETTSNGGREVWGFATLERKDKVGEIADFDRTVKAFQNWSDEVSKRTGGKSMGNVRVMHQAVTGGKMTHWEPGETEIVDEKGNKQTVKGIWTATYVPPHKTDVIKDIDEGILSGLSIGGEYEERWWDEAQKGFRFAPKLAEYSFVDNPCVEGADIVNVIAKADGPWSRTDRNLSKATNEEREKLHADAEERAKSSGIAVKDGGHLTPPKGKPTDEAEYADPTNYAYPIDSAHIKAAVGYFNHPDEREKGGYSESEWAIIGKRIAEAANKLIGDGHEYKDGTIETSDERKAADKAAWGDLCKRAGVGGELSYEDIRQLVSAAINKGNPMLDFWVCDTYPEYVIADDWETGKWWKVPYTLDGTDITVGTPEEVTQGDWKPVKEANKLEDTPVQKMDPDETVTQKIADLEAAIAAVEAAQKKDVQTGGTSQTDTNVDDKLQAAKDAVAQLKAAQMKDNSAEDKEDAEKSITALEILKTINGRLEKRGTAISATRRKHLQHAVDHIHKALGEDDKIGDKEHIDGASTTPDGGMDAEKFVAAVLAKLDGTTLQKSAPDIGGALTQALENAGLAKADVVSTLSEQLTKAVEQIATLEGLVKEIGEQPQPNGPHMGAYPGLGGTMPWQGVEKSILQSTIDRIADPVVKDQVGQSMATELLLAQMGGARRPTGA